MTFMTLVVTSRKSAGTTERSSKSPQLTYFCCSIERSIKWCYDTLDWWALSLNGQSDLCMRRIVILLLLRFVRHRLINCIPWTSQLGSREEAFYKGTDLYILTGNTGLEPEILKSIGHLYGHTERSYKGERGVN